MKYTVKEVKRIFLDYFKNHEHKQIKNSSIIPENDDSLLFINGPNQKRFHRPTNSRKQTYVQYANLYPYKRY